jgi:hypothetical protein
MDPMKESRWVVGVKSPIFLISLEMNIQINYDGCQYFGMMGRLSGESGTPPSPHHLSMAVACDEGSFQDLLDRTKMEPPRA